MASETIDISIYVLMDYDGEWAAMGLHDAPPPKTWKELRTMMRDWNLDENLGFTKCYRVTVPVPVPDEEEFVELDFAKLEELGWV